MTTRPTHWCRVLSSTKKRHFSPLIPLGVEDDTLKLIGCKKKSSRVVKATRRRKLNLNSNRTEKEAIENNFIPIGLMPRVGPWRKEKKWMKFAVYYNNLFSLPLITISFCDNKNKLNGLCLNRSQLKFYWIKNMQIIICGMTLFATVICHQIYIF